jgi:hypothetical protein
MTTIEMEIYLSKFFNFRKNIIVPNVSWGLNIHECDLFIISKSGYVTEIEIKISKSDLIKDKDKKHSHESNRIKNLYFAFPDNIDIEFIKEHIPRRAGIIIVKNNGICHIYRGSEINKKAVKLKEKEIYQVARLGAMRIWSLKNKIVKEKKKLLAEQLDMTNQQVLKN